MRGLCARREAIFMSLLPKRSRWHLRLAVLVAGGSAVGLLVTAWVPKAWVGVLGGSITAVVTAVALGVQVEWQRRSEVVRRLPGALEASSASGRFPLVQEMSDPIAVGV